MGSGLTSTSAGAHGHRRSDLPDRPEPVYRPARNGPFTSLSEQEKDGADVIINGQVHHSLEIGRSPGDRYVRACRVLLTGRPATAERMSQVADPSEPRLWLQSTCKLTLPRGPWMSTPRPPKREGDDGLCRTDVSGSWLRSPTSGWLNDATTSV